MKRIKIRNNDISYFDKIMVIYMTEKELHLRWETETKYYNIFLTKDLFGEWILDRHWGGKIDRRRGDTVTCCNSYRDALKKLKKLRTVRKKRGYI